LCDQESGTTVSTIIYSASARVIAIAWSTFPNLPPAGEKGTSMPDRAKEWAKDDPEFVRQQIQKLIDSGELTKEEGENLLRMRYPSLEDKR